MSDLESELYVVFLFNVICICYLLRKVELLL